jgi:hypothetical protein
MYLFAVSPKDALLDHRDWALSTSKNSWYVFAKDEWNARMDVSICCGIAARRDKGPTRHNPWTQDNLVECRVVDHPGDPFIKPGFVVSEHWVYDLEDPYGPMSRDHLELIQELRRQ